MKRLSDLHRVLPALCLALVLLPACSSLSRAFGGTGLPGSYTVDEVPGAVSAAEADLAAGRPELAFDRLRVARETRGLDPALRDEVRVLLEQTSDELISELSGDDADADRLASFLDMELPRQIAVTAAVRAAALRVAEGEHRQAFKLIQRLDEKYPTHHERAAAGAVLAEAGLTLASDDGHFLGLFAKRDNAKPILSYLTIYYPSEPRCDQAYATLAALDEENGLWADAIMAHEDLLLWHSDSHLAQASQARIPHLRLAALSSPEYDQRELIWARNDLEIFLADFGPEGDTAAGALNDLDDTLRRLVESDLSIASFYRRVDNSYGRQYHARRALDNARELSAGDLIRRATEMFGETSDTVDDSAPGKDPKTE
ncbi:MAG: hypothetical protein QF724_02075 [Planctomycetota bacterium]|nr:hypothetical protein [Planctomycetota bacterium]MDP6518429.1 hypothetical protein [Planctomycetota bacterium]MDP6837701.1 hypothetical protein [Planctomycetota bacterium]MDP6956585.1 hypothetical protein [Planctomycetota bacterium]